jgi:hypothetical protein
VRLLLALTLAAALCLPACRSGQDAGPAGPTQGREADTALREVARVVCEPNGTRLETPSVRSRPDGVHFEIVNETGRDRSFSVLDGQGGGVGENAPIGTSTKVVALGPGTLMVTCSDPLADVEQGSSLEVVDEDGVWVSMKLDCATTFSATIDYVRQGQGDPDPLAADEKGLENYMQPGDVVEPAGYSDAANPVFRLVLSDEVLGVVDLMDDGAGGWLPSTVSGCSSLEESE